MKESLDQLNTRAQRMIWEARRADKIDFAGPESRFDTNLGSQLGNCTLPGELNATRQPRQPLGRLQIANTTQFNAADRGRTDLYKQDLLPRYEELKQVAQHIADMNMSNMISVDGQAKRTLRGRAQQPADPGHRRHGPGRPGGLDRRRRASCGPLRDFTQSGPPDRSRQSRFESADPLP